MPWIVNNNDEREYKPSLYTKEELPTWAEMYYEFYQKKLYHTIKNDEIDPYWNIPRSLVLLSICCNELNKMLYEDGKRNDILEKFELTDIRFLISSSVLDDLEEGYHGVPPIYTIPLPTGKENPFITNNHPRIDVSIISKNPIPGRNEASIELYIQKENSFDIYCNYESGIFNDIIDVLMKDIIEYYSGDRPGWKDKDGKTIESDNKGCITGFDPAL